MCFDDTILNSMSHCPAILQPSSEDIKMMLACDVHRGTSNLDSNMKRYIWGRRSDGFFFFNFFHVKITINFFSL